VRRWIILAAALCACHGRDAREGSAPRDVAARPALAHATQADLARELDDADRHGTWADVRARWQGQQLHWNVTRQRLLCSSPSACHVAVFPIERPAKHGWLPELDFAPGEFEKLEAQCQGHDQCDVAIDGTLAALQASADLPTSVRIADVRIRT
jgi:hypothetical protein